MGVALLTLRRYGRIGLIIPLDSKKKERESNDFVHGTEKRSLGAIKTKLEIFDTKVDRRAV